MRQTIATKGYQAREKQNGRRPTAVGPGAPSASSKPPRRPPVVLPEKQPYPTRSTNNDRLMLGIRACVAFDVPQAAPLCIAILVRCGGKGYCLPSTAVWMGDTDASQHTVERWRSILTETGLIEMQSAAIRTNVRATFVMKMVRSKAKAEADGVEVPPYPRGSTDNELLMKGARVLVGHKASEAFEAFALYVAIVVRCGGKGHYWASSAVWKRDTGASQLSVERWRSILVHAGLIEVKRRGNNPAEIFLTARTGFRLELPPESVATETDVSRAEVDHLVHSLAKRRGVGDAMPATPSPLQVQDLMRDSRFNPNDWRKLRAASEWSKNEQQEMDVDYERFGEDHAYHIWRGRLLDKWREQSRGL